MGTFGTLRAHKERQPFRMVQRVIFAGRRRLPALLRRGSERAATRLRDYLLRRGYPPSEVMRTVARLTGARSDGPDETC